MRVLHVSLGLPPLRTGGLTRYCTELMEAQVSAGDFVMLLYPGHFSIGGSYIRQGSWRNVVTYELVNPLPVALTYGISNPKDFMRPFDRDVFVKLLSSSKPDVVHVHSFMGIPREFFEVTKSMGILQVFTTHDYYSICPRCTFVTNCGLPCVDGPSAGACAMCNAGTGMSLQKSKIMQSRLYARLKDSKFVRCVGTAVKRRMQRDASELPSSIPDASLQSDIGIEDSYGSLLAYNASIVDVIDVLICNSRQTQMCFKAAFPKKESVLLPITHAGLDLSDGFNRPARPEGCPVRVGYFGGYKAYKGYDILMAALSRLCETGWEFEAHLYGGDYPDIHNGFSCINEGRLEPSNVSKVLNTLDMVVVPSRYPETFGFVVLESICSGTPVVCSDVVGAADLLPPECVFEEGNIEALCSCIISCANGHCSTAVLQHDYPISMTMQVAKLRTIYHAGGKLE